MGTIVGGRQDEIKIWDGETHVEVDERTGAIIAIDIPHNKIHEGDSFSICHLFYLVADEVSANIVFDIHATKEAHLVVGVAVGGDAEARLFESVVTSSKGTALDINNRNRTLSGVNLVKAYHTPTITTSGTVLDCGFLMGGQRQQAIGTTGSTRGEWLLRSGTSYMISITNTAAAAKNISIRAEWYERGV